MSQGKKRGGVRKTAPTNQKKTKRSDYEYPHLEPSAALSRRREEVEDVASYAHKLNDKEKAWLNQFMREYNDTHTENAVMHTADEILYDKDGNIIMTTNRWGMVDENSVPMTSRKLAHDRNNSRNRCDYTIAKSMGLLNYIESDEDLERIMQEDYEEDED